MTTSILLKRGCPFCLKLRIWATETGVADRFDFRTSAEGEPEIEEWRAAITASGQKASFPAADMGGGSYLLGSDELIGRFAAAFGVPASGPLLEYYKAGVMANLLNLYRENLELRGANSAG